MQEPRYYKNYESTVFVFDLKQSSGQDIKKKMEMKPLRQHSKCQGENVHLEQSSEQAMTCKEKQWGRAHGLNLCIQRKRLFLPFLAR